LKAEIVLNSGNCFLMSDTRSSLIARRRRRVGCRSVTLMAGATTGDSARKALLKVARRAAAEDSTDPEVIEEAADHAVVQFERYQDSIAANEAARRKWVKVVARNHARKVGAKLDRELPMGAAGSIPPLWHDSDVDERVEKLIAEMRSGQQPSLGWLVAMKVDFERRWSLLGREVRALLQGKYVEGYSSKEIAEQRGLAPGTVDNKLFAAKATARLVFEDLT
jgi:DNA-directed RNA polymerase specialized sigma24 family protein